MIFIIIDLLQKFDYKIDKTNIKEFLEALQKLEEHQHKIFLEDLNKYCDDNNMMITKKIIKKILNNGEKNMHYYQFFS